MTYSRLCSWVCTFAGLLLWTGAASANMSATPWIHELIQNGPDVVIEFAVFDETEATNDDGEPLPGLDAAYTLQLVSHEDYYAVFEGRVFDPAEADSVSGYTCHVWDSWNEGSCEEGAPCVDCDDDGTDECDGFCGVAYYYTVVDECPPLSDGETMYSVHTEPPYDLYYEGEGLGFETMVIEDVGAACQHPDDGGCSASRAGVRPVTGVLRCLAALFG
jgi:hypothetical protein